MAGSYNHCVDDDGNLLDWERLAGSLENGGDVYEAVEELYGMIWWLADDGTRGDVKAAVELARQNYQEGLEIARRENGGAGAF